jgi:hypothetical protein
MMFPIGLINLCVVYVLETYKLAYYYRCPPNYSISTSSNLIERITTIAPCFYLGFGFWMYGNKQIYGDLSLQDSTDEINYHDIINPQMYHSDNVITNHWIGPSLTHFRPGTLFMLLPALFFLINLILGAKCFTETSTEEVDLELT